jgi:protein phosphatase
VGDVRAYLCRASLLTRLTADHTEVANLVSEGILSIEEARHYPFRHRVDRAVGIAPAVRVEVQCFNFLPGDRMLFCSDGLWNMVEDHRLAVSLAQESDPGSCTERLRQEALAAGGEDNITLIVVDINAECK